MGYEIPAAIGAYHASKQEVICIAGDGSIMMNLQELAIIGSQKLPIKIFLLNKASCISSGSRLNQSISLIGAFPLQRTLCMESKGIPEE